MVTAAALRRSRHRTGIARTSVTFASSPLSYRSEASGDLPRQQALPPPGCPRRTAFVLVQVPDSAQALAVAGKDLTGDGSVVGVRGYAAHSVPPGLCSQCPARMEQRWLLRVKSSLTREAVQLMGWASATMMPSGPRT